MSIRRLPDEAVNKIKSSAIITSFNGVAAGLIKNSLDGGASKVNISVDYSRGNCTIEDNGDGIHSDDFQEDGGLGKLHYTSKYPPNSQVHGKHGTFLASLATLSLVLISSHHRQYVSHPSVLFHNSRVLARHSSAPPEHRLVTFEHGTRIIVRDLFGSMPVRVKQRGIMSSDRSNVDKEWSRLVLETIGILLAWPSEVTVWLKESSSQRELKLKTPDKVNAVLKMSRLLNQASLTDNVSLDSWVPVSAAAGLVRCTGCVSTIPSSSRRIQFISIGIQPLLNSYGTNALYEEINKVFANSSFGAVEGDRHKTDSDGDKSDNITGRELKVRKGVDRWPMFHLQLEIQAQPCSDLDDILDDRTNDLAAITDLLKAMCYSFLKRHHYRPHKLRATNQNSVFSSATKLGVSKRPPSASQSSSRSSSKEPEAKIPRQDSPFETWQRVKVGHAPKWSTVKQVNGADDVQVSKAPLVGKGGQLLRRPFDDIDSDVILSTQQSAHFTPSQEPHTPIVDFINASPPEEVSSSSAAKRVLERRPKPQASKWLQDVVSAWKNPIFETAPQQIPRTYNDGAGTDTLAAGVRSNYFAGDENCGVRFESMSIKNLGGRISKQALLEADVIAQVDRKFILVRLPMDGVYGPSQGPDTSALVILDQHAADERCRLEELMSNYFVLDSSRVIRSGVERVEDPIVFEVTAAESNALRQYQAFFASWGIVYSVQPPSKQGQHTITVSALPPSIFGRCTTEPRLLTHLLRTQIHDQPHPPPLPSFSLAQQQPHISNFYGCPRGILELLYSRSCRSAIMFNDELTKEECQDLVRRLAGCAFPFQCAHGRPSMVPLLDLGVGSKVGGWEGDKAAPGSATWNEWIR